MPSVSERISDGAGGASFLQSISKVLVQKCAYEHRRVSQVRNRKILTAPCSCTVKTENLL
jgi:hypothetical protein